MYLAIRVHTALHEPLFVNSAGEVVSSQAISNVLKNAVGILGLNKRDFNTHSFRIGHTTDLYLANVSDDLIRRSGRWKSDAWKMYVKTPLLVSF